MINWCSKNEEDVIAVAMNATNLEFRKAKELEKFPARRRRDWEKISVLMTTSRQAYQLYINEKRILRSIFLV